MHSTWRNQKDVMDDIWALSEMEGIASHEVVEPPPETILEYRAQMEANNTGSIYDMPELDGEGVTYIISGRGRGGISTILRPGLSELSDIRVTEDVERRLRQVAGLGYSNELIEQGVRAMTIAHEETKKSPTSKTASSSKTSSAYKTSGLCSPMEKNRNSSSSSSLSSNSPRPAKVENADHPPPLSVMRKRAQEERMKNKQKQISEESSPKKSEDPPRNNSPKVTQNGQTSSRPTQNGQTSSRPIQNGHSSPRLTQNERRSPWSNGSSDEGSWRRRDVNTANRFFKQPAASFNLNCNDFPALK